MLRRLYPISESMSNEVDLPSTKETLWHSLRADLSQYVPQLRDRHVLMCCCCGRFLPFEDFNLEHIVPKQALAEDDDEVKKHLSINQRSVIILLCNKGLVIKGRKAFYNSGCNSWKGRFYDKRIRSAVNGHIFTPKAITEPHIIALSCMAYLALVKEYGYQIALTQAGVVMREQFFSPFRYIKRMPLMCRVVLGSDKPPSFEEADIDFWRTPFKFDLDESSCVVVFRNFGIRLPLSRDPRTPIARHLAIKPKKYALRPDFSTAFE
jgi:hypothetical protein